MCACRPCYLLFTERGAGAGKFASVPDRYLFDPDFTISDAQWEQFQIPVKMAFFFVNSVIEQTVIFYPSPAGATESLLPADTWDRRSWRPTRYSPPSSPTSKRCSSTGGTSAYECFLAPIDACYELVGHVRMNWKGFDGGQEAWEAIDGFFDHLRARSRSASPARNGGPA